MFRFINSGVTYEKRQKESQRVFFYSTLWHMSDDVVCGREFFETENFNEQWHSNSRTSEHHLLYVLLTVIGVIAL